MRNRPSFFGWRQLFWLFWLETARTVVVFFGWSHLLGTQPSLHSALMVVPFGWQPSLRNNKNTTVCVGYGWHHHGQCVPFHDKAETVPFHDKDCVEGGAKSGW